MEEEVKEISIREAYEHLTAMYPGLMIGIGCSIHDEGDRAYWYIDIKELRPPVCERCQLPEKMKIATVYVAETWAEALKSITRQMEEWKNVKEVVNG